MCLSFLSFNYFVTLLSYIYNAFFPRCMYVHSPLTGNGDGSSSPDVISSHGGSPSEYSKRSKHSFGPNTFKVEINYAAKITLRPISFAIQGSKAEHVHDALRVLDTILRQQASDRHFELSLLFMFLNFFLQLHMQKGPSYCFLNLWVLEAGVAF